jgi:hypothetical protein
LGRRAALVGLALSLFCLTGAITAQLSHTWLTRTQARRMVELWLSNVLSGELEIADQLTQPYESRFGGSLEVLRQEYEQQPSLKERLEGYSKSDVMKRLIDARKHATTYSLVQILEEGEQVESFEVRLGAIRPQDGSGAFSTWRVQPPAPSNPELQSLPL